MFPPCNGLEIRPYEIEYLTQPRHLWLTTGSVGSGKTAWARTTFPDARWHDLRERYWPCLSVNLPLVLDDPDPSLYTVEDLALDLLNQRTRIPMYYQSSDYSTLGTLVITARCDSAVSDADVEIMASRLLALGIVLHYQHLSWY